LYMKKLNLSWLWTFLLVFVTAGISEVRAQNPTTVAGLFFRTLTNGNLAADKDGNPLDMSTGATTHLTPLAPATGAGSNAINIAWPTGFTYTFPTGTANSQVLSWSVASNGCIGLSPTATSGITSGNNIAGGTGIRMGAFITGLSNGGVSDSGVVRSKVFGTAPNQVLVVEFLNMKFTNTSPNAAGDVTYQVRFYENGNMFEFVYGEMALGGGSSTTVRAGVSTSSTAATNFNVDFNAHDAIYGSLANTFNTVGPLAPFAGTTATTRRVYQFAPTAFPQQFAASSFSQASGSLPSGSTNQVIARLDVAATGTANPLDLTSIAVGTAGTNASAISNLKVFYTGTSNVFADTAQFGTTVAAPAASNTITGSRTLLSGTNYFWVTYDIPATATVGDTVRATFGDFILAGVTRTPAAPAAPAFRIVRTALTGTITVGTGGQYPNLGAAFSDIGFLGLSGNVNLNIISNITEPTAAVLGQWSETGAGGYTLTIRPTGANRVISGDIASSGVIVLVGADRVTIDGRVGGTGTGRDLTIRNDNNTAINTAILIAGQTTSVGGSDDVTIRNTVLMAGPTVGTTTATAAIQVQGTGAPSNNLVITNNEIKRSYRGIFMGTNAPTSPHLGLQITNNILGSNDPQEYNIFRGIQVNQSRGAVISGNTIFNQLTTLNISIAGIEILTGADSAVISANRIYSIKNPTTSGYGAYGINLAAGPGHLVVNNDISDIATTNYSATSNTFNAFGIRITTGTGHRIHHNTVNMSGAYTSSNTTAGAAAVCITAAAVTAEMINNNFSNTITSTATGNKNIFAIWLPTATYSFANLSGTNYNNYFLGSEPYHIFAQRGTTFGANTIANIGAWQTAASVDANSIAVNPLFLAADLGLPNAPAMNGLGTPLASVTTDVNGATRSTTAPDMGAYEYTPINTDLAAVSLERVSSGCFGAAESIRAIVRNTGLNAIQFGTDTLRLTLNVTGAATATVNLTLASGTLAAGDTLHVNVGPFNLSSFGNYSIAGSINQQNDGFAQNNNFAAVSFSNVAPLSVPFAYDFESTSNTATLGNLQAAGWSIASPWTIGAGGHGNPGNGLYANIWNSANNLTPSFTLPLAGPVLANSSFAFNYRLMNFSSYSTAPTTYSPSAADSIWFEISTDCGVTYSRLYTIDSASHTVDSAWASISVPLAQYAGQNVTIRLRSQWATGDYFLDLDNIGITAPLSAFSLVAPPNNTRLVAAGAGSAPVNVSWTSAIQGPATYTWLVDAPSGNFSNPLVALPANNNGLDTNLTLTISQIHNLLGTLGVAIGDSTNIIWTVRAQLGTQTLQATQTWAAKLVRGTLAPLRLAAAPVGGGGTTGLRAPNGTAAHTFFRGASFVPASELAAAGIDSGVSIASFALRTTTGASSAARGKMTLYLSNGQNATYTRGTAWTGAINGLNVHHDDSVTIQTGIGTMTLELSQPFVYTGGSIELAYEWNGSAPFATAAAVYAANVAITGSLVSAASATTPPATMGATQFRPEFIWGVDDRKANEVEVVTVFAKGQNPVQYGTPEVISAVVRNNGYEARTNVPVTLNVAGANTFTNVQTIANLGVDSVTTVNFANFTGTAVGFNNMTVNVPADENNANNSKAWAQQQTDSIFSYNDTVTVGNGAVGYNTGSGLLLTRYSINGTRSVAAARVRIGDGAAIAGNTVFAVVIIDSVIVAQSAPVVLSAADLSTWVVFPFPAPVNITNGSFFIGLAQTASAGTGYFPVAFQAEAPTRANAYFTAPVGGGVPAPVNNFRLMIEAHVGPEFIPADTLSRFNLVAPANNTTLNIQGDPTQTAQIRWRTSTRVGGVGTTTYEWLLDVPAGDFSNPVLTVAAGADTSLTLTYGQIVDSLAAKGVPVGGGFSGRWIVRATNGPVSRLANIPFTITLNRGVMTSIEETDFSKAISLYPNPAAYTAKLQVNVPGEKVLSVVIVNAVGQEMKKFHVSSSVANDMELDLTNLNEGLYFVRISDGNDMAIKRLMIQR
jgi:hypothetical protein